MTTFRRKRPARGVLEFPDRTTVVFVTVCTVDHQAWLSHENIHSVLRTIWLEAQAWLVGPYLIMPDHIHLFAARGDIDFTLQRWTHFWKRNVTRSLPDGHPRLLDDQRDTRMRNGKHFTETWEYVRNNPVRKGLVARPEDWPYQGTIHEWTYMGP